MPPAAKKEEPPPGPTVTDISILLDDAQLSHLVDALKSTTLVELKSVLDASGRPAMLTHLKEHGVDKLAVCSLRT